MNQDDERWDVPSSRLARLANGTATPGMRECPSCMHRHPQGERCSYPASKNDLRGCPCEG